MAILQSLAVFRMATSALIYSSRVPVESSGVSWGETGFVLFPLLLIGCTQERVRGKLMTPAIDASSWKAWAKAEQELDVWEWECATLRLGGPHLGQMLTTETTKFSSFHGLRVLSYCCGVKLKSSRLPDQLTAIYHRTSNSSALHEQF